MPRVFVVTGSNKGIGYAIVRKLAKTVDDAVIYLTGNFRTHYMLLNSV